MTDIETLRAIKDKITAGKKRYARLKDLLREYKAEFTTEDPDSPLMFAEIEEQIETMKTRIRIERELINANVMRWRHLKEASCDGDI